MSANVLAFVLGIIGTIAARQLYIIHKARQKYDSEDEEQKGGIYEISGKK